MFSIRLKILMWQMQLIYDGENFISQNQYIVVEHYQYLQMIIK